MGKYPQQNKKQTFINKGHLYKYVSRKWKISEKEQKYYDKK